MDGWAAQDPETPKDPLMTWVEYRAHWRCLYRKLFYGEHSPGKFFD